MNTTTTLIHDLHSKLATVQTHMQLALERISKYHALPESDQKRACRIRLAYVVLDHHHATQRLLIQRLKEAEAEQASSR